MKVFDGFGLTVEGDATQAVITRAKKLAVDTRLEADARGLLAYRKWVNLPDGGYAFSIKHGGIVRVHYVPGVKEVDQQSQRVEPVPDFASGWITNGRITTETDARGRPVDVIGEFTPTAGTAARLKLRTGVQKSRRFAVVPAAERPDLNGPPGTALSLSQYALLKASMFSGKMKRVVQGLMAFGRTGVPTAFRRTLLDTNALPGEGARPSAEEIAAANTGVQVRYDSRFYRTHGIATAADGKLWLVEIGTRGVLAMRLPVWPRSATETFRAYVETRDDEAFRMIEEFGGFPSGETIPTDAALLAAMRRSGLVIQLATAAQLAPFYRLQPFSSVTGWAFNERGSEAHNVGSTSNAAGLLVAEHWHAQFSIGAATKPTDTEVLALAVNLRAKLITVLGPSRRYREAVLSKAEYLSAVVLRQLDSTAVSAPQRVFDELDAISVVRAAGNCVVGRAFEGIYYHPNGFAPPPIKFHEPLLGGLLSVDMRREGRQTTEGVPVVMDTTLHVYFIGNRLKAVKYYWDRSVGDAAEVESNFEECMYQGNWEKRERSGGGVTPVGFYTTDMDFRERVSPTEVDTTVVGKRLGRHTSVSDDLVQPSRGYATRSTTFLQQYDSVTRAGSWQRTAVIIPDGVREGSIFVHESTTGSTTRYTGYSVSTLGDPYSYTTWRLFGKVSPEGVFIGGWADPDFMHACGNRQKRRIDGNSVMYNPNACSDLVDEGGWGTTCQVVEPTDPPDFTPPETKTSTVAHPGTLRVFIDYPVLGGAIEAFKQEYVLTPDDGGFYPWERNFVRTPGAFGTIQYAAANFNCLGDGTILISATGADGFGPGYVRGTPYSEVFKTKNTTFVGVIDA